MGFTRQDTLANFASGLMILVYRLFDIDDCVDAAGIAIPYPQRAGHIIQSNKAD